MPCHFFFQIENRSRTKYILTWCTGYGNLKYGWKFGEEKFISEGCPESRCFLTSNRNYLSSVSEFDAIMFHQRTIQLKKVPAKRRPEQRYVHWMIESPANDNYDLTPAKHLAGFFNWSMSYRLDSHFPKPYGKFIEVQFTRVDSLGFLLIKLSRDLLPLPPETSMITSNNLGRKISIFPGKPRQRERDWLPGLSPTATVRVEGKPW